jgi:hypothetical protein
LSNISFTFMKNCSLAYLTILFLHQFLISVQDVSLMCSI